MIFFFHALGPLTKKGPWFRGGRRPLHACDKPMQVCGSRALTNFLIGRR